MSDYLDQHGEWQAKKRAADSGGNETYHAWTTRGLVPCDPPRRYRRITERVCAKDRDWFERHPEATEYHREYVPGEAWPAQLPQGSIIRVRQIVPGVRLRELVGVEVAR